MDYKVTALDLEQKKAIFIARGDIDRAAKMAERLAAIPANAVEIIEKLEEFAWEALMQGTYVNSGTGDTLDNMCMSTWEMLSTHFAEKGWLTGDNGRIYKIVPHSKRPKEAHHG